VTSEELAARAQAAPPEANADGEIAVGADANEYTDTDPSALTEFQPALAGHGEWVDDSTYGTVWVPSQAEVGSDFVPYTTAGHWTYAEDTSYVWVSDYSWGWAPFHYGRWVHVGHHGWAWIPGRTYSGAWVVWRTGSGYDYVGWAPAGPDWYWYNGYAVGWTFGWSPYYSYCHHDHLYNPRLGGYVVRGDTPRGRDYEAHTRPYVAAAPTVGAGGSGRVAANPTVGGAGAGGRIAASPRVGPRPAELGIRADHVTPPPGDHAGLARAKALSSPTTAVAHGAAPPASVPRRRDPEVMATAPAPRGEFGRAPAGNNRFDAAARAPQYEGVAPVPPRPSSSSAFDARSSARSFGAPSAPPRVATPTPASSYRTPPSAGFAQQQPSMRSTPSAPTPSYRSNPPSFSQPSRSAPSVTQSAPSFRSSAPPTRSAPSFSAPAVRSSPAPSRPSTPSRSSAPAARGRR
jgi:hypothetical protein